jgi:hypothetical protein
MVYKLLIPVAFKDDNIIYEIFYSDVIIEGAIILEEFKID